MQSRRRYLVSLVGAFCLVLSSGCEQNITNGTPPVANGAPPVANGTPPVANGAPPATNTTPPALTDAQKALVIFLLETVFTSPADGKWSDSADCMSGTVTVTPLFESSTISFSQCLTRVGQALNGTIGFTLDIAGPTARASYDLQVTGSPSASVNSAMQVNGTQTTAGIEGTELTFNMTGIIDGETYTLTGSPTASMSGLISGNVNVAVNTISLTCIFSDLNIATAKTSDFESACGITLAKSPLSAAQIADFQACTTDSDCKFVTNGCCDCANGGEEAAVNSSRETVFLAMFNCSGIACTEKARVPPCGCGSVSCSNGLCIYSTDTCAGL